MDPIKIREINSKPQEMKQLREEVLYNGKRFVILEKDNELSIAVLSNKEIKEKTNEYTVAKKTDDFTQEIFQDENVKELVDLRTSQTYARKKFTLYKKTKTEKINALRAKFGLVPVDDKDVSEPEKTIENFEEIKNALKKGECLFFDLEDMSLKTKNLGKGEKFLPIDKHIHYLLKKFKLSFSEKLELAILLNKSSGKYSSSALKRAVEYLVPKETLSDEEKQTPLKDNAKRLVELSKCPIAPFKKEYQLQAKNLYLKHFQSLKEDPSSLVKDFVSHSSTIQKLPTKLRKEIDDVLKGYLDPEGYIQLLETLSKSLDGGGTAVSLQTTLEAIEKAPGFHKFLEKMDTSKQLSKKYQKIKKDLHSLLKEAKKERDKTINNIDINNNINNLKQTLDAIASSNASGTPFQMPENISDENYCLFFDFDSKNLKTSEGAPDPKHCTSIDLAVQCTLKQNNLSLKERCDLAGQLSERIKIKALKSKEKKEIQRALVLLSTFDTNPITTSDDYFYLDSLNQKHKVRIQTEKRLNLQDHIKTLFKEGTHDAIFYSIYEALLTEEVLEKHVEAVCRLPYGKEFLKRVEPQKILASKLSSALSEYKKSQTEEKKEKCKELLQHLKEIHAPQISIEETKITELEKEKHYLVIDFDGHLQVYSKEEILEKKKDDYPIQTRDLDQVISKLDGKLSSDEITRLKTTLETKIEGKKRRKATDRGIKALEKLPPAQASSPRVEPINKTRHDIDRKFEKSLPPLTWQKLHFCKQHLPRTWEALSEGKNYSEEAFKEEYNALIGKLARCTESEQINDPVIKDLVSFEKEIQELEAQKREIDRTPLQETSETEMPSAQQRIQDIEDNYPLPAEDQIKSTENQRLISSIDRKRENLSALKNRNLGNEWKIFQISINNLKKIEDYYKEENAQKSKTDSASSENNSPEMESEEEYVNEKNSIRVTTDQLNLEKRETRKGVLNSSFPFPDAIRSAYDSFIRDQIIEPIIERAMPLLKLNPSPIDKFKELQDSVYAYFNCLDELASNHLKQCSPYFEMAASIEKLTQMITSQTDTSEDLKPLEKKENEYLVRRACINACEKKSTELPPELKEKPLDSNFSLEKFIIKMLKEGHHDFIFDFYDALLQELKNEISIVESAQNPDENQETNALKTHLLEAEKNFTKLSQEIEQQENTLSELSKKQEVLDRKLKSLERARQSQKKTDIDEEIGRVTSESSEVRSTILDSTSELSKKKFRLETLENRKKYLTSLKNGKLVDPSQRLKRLNTFYRLRVSSIPYSRQDLKRVVITHMQDSYSSEIEGNLFKIQEKDLEKIKSLDFYENSKEDHLKYIIYTGARDLIEKILVPAKLSGDPLFFIFNKGVTNPKDLNYMEALATFNNNEHSSEACWHKTTSYVEMPAITEEKTTSIVQASEKMSLDVQLPKGKKVNTNAILLGMAPILTTVSGVQPELYYLFCELPDSATTDTSIPINPQFQKFLPPLTWQKLHFCKQHLPLTWEALSEGQDFSEATFKEEYQKLIEKEVQHPTYPELDENKSKKMMEQLVRFEPKIQALSAQKDALIQSQREEPSEGERDLAEKIQAIENQFALPGNSQGAVDIELASIERKLKEAQLLKDRILKNELNFLKKAGRNFREMKEVFDANSSQPQEDLNDPNPAIAQGIKVCFRSNNPEGTETQYNTECSSIIDNVDRINLSKEEGNEQTLNASLPLVDTIKTKYNSIIDNSDLTFALVEGAEALQKVDQADGAEALQKVDQYKKFQESVYTYFDTLDEIASEQINKWTPYFETALKLEIYIQNLVSTPVEEENLPLKLERAENEQRVMRALRRACQKSTLLPDEMKSEILKFSEFKDIKFNKNIIKEGYPEFALDFYRELLVEIQNDYALFQPLSEKLLNEAQNQDSSSSDISEICDDIRKKAEESIAILDDEIKAVEEQIHQHQPMTTTDIKSLQIEQELLKKRKAYYEKIRSNEPDSLKERAKLLNSFYHHRVSSLPFTRQDLQKKIKKSMGGSYHHQEEGRLFCLSDEAREKIKQLSLYDGFNPENCDDFEKICKEIVIEVMMPAKLQDANLFFVFNRGVSTTRDLNSEKDDPLKTLFKSHPCEVCWHETSGLIEKPNIDNNGIIEAIGNSEKMLFDGTDIDLSKKQALFAIAPVLFKDENRLTPLQYCCYEVE